MNIPNYTAGSETKTGRNMINFVHLIGITLLVALISACQPTTDDSSVLASAKEGYKTFQGGDMTAWANTQAEDVVWTIPEGFPYSGTYVGPQAVIDGVFTPIMQLWPDFRVEVVNYHPSGNTVFISTRIHAGGQSSDSMHVAVIEDGKYASFKIFDNAEVMMRTAMTGKRRALNNPDHVSAEWQIAAYSSAAPDYLGGFATVIGGEGEVLREGSNGWTCLSLNPRPFPEKGWRDAHDAMPGCGDAEGMKWMNAALSGVKPDLQRDTFIWMLHGDVGEDNTKMGVLSQEDSTPGEWIESGPHLMLMPKDPSTLTKFHADFSTGDPYVMMPGSDYAHLMIPLTDYYEYQPQSSPLSN